MTCEEVLFSSISRSYSNRCQIDWDAGPVALPRSRVLKMYSLKNRDYSTAGVFEFIFDQRLRSARFENRICHPRCFDGQLDVVRAQNVSTFQNQGSVGGKIPVKAI